MVVGWPWLFFKDYDLILNPLRIGKAELKKIVSLSDRLKYAYLADGIGVDFHKGGFAPFTNSIFLSRNASDLYSLSNPDKKLKEIEPYHYTFCNSRGATDILSAWNVLQSVGVQGFQSYVVNIVKNINIFMSILPQYGFEIIDKENTYGFAVIIWTNHNNPAQSLESFMQEDDAVIEKNNRYLYALSEYIKNQYSGYYIRFLPDYNILSLSRKSAVLSLLSMTLNLDEKKSISIANELGGLKLKFDKIYNEKTYDNLAGSIPHEVPK